MASASRWSCVVSSPSNSATFDQRSLICLGELASVSTRSQLANEEFERFLATQEINPTHLREMRTVFTAFLLDSDCRELLMEGRFAKLRARDANLYGSLSHLSTQERDTLLGYLQSQVSLKQFEMAA